MSDVNDVDWVFYEDRPEWKDVEPVEQNDGPYPVVQIAYSDKFKDIFDYFRAVLSRREISERAFQLCEDAAAINPSNYTVWHYRRILLKELKKDLYKELDFCQQNIEDNKKSYQMWYHRQVLVEWLKDPSKEKKFTERILMDDPKNYHAWQHRQWVIKEFDLWDGELDFVTCLLEDDVRNNSAWNQRYFVVHRSGEVAEEVLKGEIAYTLDQIKKAPNNESPWNYLRGLLQDSGLSRFPEVREFCEERHGSGCRSPHLLGFLVDLLEEDLLAEVNGEKLSRACDLCLALALKHDNIRKEYWLFIAKNLLALHGNAEDTLSQVSAISDKLADVEP